MLKAYFVPGTTLSVVCLCVSVYYILQSPSKESTSIFLILQMRKLRQSS